MKFADYPRVDNLRTNDLLLIDGERGTKSIKVSNAMATVGGQTLPERVPKTEMATTDKILMNEGANEITGQDLAASVVTMAGLNEMKKQVTTMNPNDTVVVNSGDNLIAFSDFVESVKPYVGGGEGGSAPLPVPTEKTTLEPTDRIVINEMNGYVTAETLYDAMPTELVKSMQWTNSNGAEGIAAPGEDSAEGIAAPGEASDVVVTDGKQMFRLGMQGFGEALKPHLDIDEAYTVVDTVPDNDYIPTTQGNCIDVPKLKKQMMPLENTNHMEEAMGFVILDGNQSISLADVRHYINLSMSQGSTFTNDDFKFLGDNGYYSVTAKQLATYVLGKINPYSHLIDSFTDSTELLSDNGEYSIRLDYLADYMKDKNGGLRDSESFYNALDGWIPVEIRRTIYRGKKLGSVFTDSQKVFIKNGMFRGLFIGDYWEDDRGNRLVVSDFDYFDTSEHHIVVSLLDSGNFPSISAKSAYKQSNAFEGLFTANSTCSNFFGNSSILSRNVPITSNNTYTTETVQGIDISQSMLIGHVFPYEIDALLNTDSVQLALFRIAYRYNSLLENFSKIINSSYNTIVTRDKYESRWVGAKVSKIGSTNGYRISGINTVSGGWQYRIIVVGVTGN